MVTKKYNMIDSTYYLPGKEPWSEAISILDEKYEKRHRYYQHVARDKWCMCLLFPCALPILLVAYSICMKNC